ncbi:MAG: endonuclease/exonuclease/phosphatase family protein [Tenacibaculum sp.]
MKRILSILFAFFLTVVIALIAFYFWASSPNLDKTSYTQLFKNVYTVKTNQDSIYSIISYNIGYLSGMTNNKAVQKNKDLFDNNLQITLDKFKKTKPDIIAFQEIDYNASRSFNINQEEEIAKLGYPFIARGVNWDERYLPFPYWPPSVHFGKVISGQSILSKYPIKDYNRIVLERVANSPFYRKAFYLDRLLQIVKINLQNAELIVMNVHLEAFDKQTREKQMQKVIELFTKQITKGQPTILLGDFNSDPNYKNPAIEKLLNLPNIGNAAFTRSNYDFTYDTENPFERLDYIFYTENSIEYIDGKVLKSFGQISDHFPVEMRFKIK